MVAGTTETGATGRIAMDATATAPTIAIAPSIAPIIEPAIAPGLLAIAKTGGAGKRLHGANVRTTGGDEKTNRTIGGASVNSRSKTSVVRTTGGFINGTWSGCVAIATGGHGLCTSMSARR